MAVTMQDVRSVLDPEEPDYEFAALLGPEALPHLETLVRANDPMLASKAAYLAGLLNDERSADVVNRAGQSDNATVRVAAAAAARHLSGSGASDVLISLLADADPGVRTVALKSVPDTATGDLRAAIEDIRTSEADAAVRDLSTEVLRRLTDIPPGSETPAAEPGGEQMSAPASSGQGEMPAGGSSGQGEMPAVGSSGQGEMPDRGSSGQGQGEMPDVGSSGQGHSEIPDLTSSGQGQGEMPEVGSSGQDQGEMPDVGFSGQGQGEMPPVGGSGQGELPRL